MAQPTEDHWFVAVGASGDAGLRNIKSLLLELGADLHAVIMVVLHRSFGLPSQLQKVLTAKAGMRIVIADDGEELVPGVCYIGEPAAHLSLLARSRGAVEDDPGQRYRGRTVDLLFRSIALHAGAKGIGVVLSGALDDGSRGVEAIHQAGGLTMVLLRRPERPGMPENAIAYDGPIDCIGSTIEIAKSIHQAVSDDQQP